MKPQQTPESRYSIKKKKGYESKETRNIFEQIEKERYRKEKQGKRKKGDLSEQKADLALDNLEEKLDGLIYFQHDATKKNGATDRYFAIDHILIFEYPEHEMVKFQIKSSETGAEEHRKLHPNIPVVIIRVSKQEIQEGEFSNVEEAEKEILDKLFKEYFLRNYGQEYYNAFLKEAYKE